MPGAEPAGSDVAPVASAADSGVELLVVGRIGKPQGIRGEVTVEVRTDSPQERFADGAVLLTDPAERGPLTVERARDHSGRLVVAFAGVPDRNAAEQLRGTLLQVDAASVPPPDDEDEFHDHVLRGMTAELPDGGRLGEVVDVLHLPHGDVLVVRRDPPAEGAAPLAESEPAVEGVEGDGEPAAPPADAEVLVPFVKAMVPVVDVAGRRLVVDPPAGLLDLPGGGG